jgi:hypothetical protein
MNPIAVACCLLPLPPAERPITDADSVLAVTYEDHSLNSPGRPALVLAVWPDGYAVWSKDRLRGGPPYFAGRVEPKRVTALLARFETDGLFDDRELTHARYGPDSAFLSVSVKAGKRAVTLSSWHELGEESDKIVGTDGGLSPLGDRRRLDVLRKEPAEHLFYRMVWAETRTRLDALLPATGRPTAGGPVNAAGVLSWREWQAK